MKNIFSKTTAEKRTQNGVKTDSKRSIYGIRILIFAFLTLGFGQAWGWTISDAKVYFDNTNSAYDCGVRFAIEKSDGCCVQSMSLISGTNNLYYWTGTWGDGAVSNLRFANASYTTGWYGWWDDVPNFGALASAEGFCSYTNTYGTDVNNAFKLFYAASGSTGANITKTDLSGYSNLNYTQTLYQCVAENGGTPAKSTASIGTISISTKKLNGNSSTTNSTGTIAAAANNTTAGAARTATVTMTATSIADGYTFLGWYTAETGGTRLESSTTYTYQATDAKTVYARFSHETTNSVNITYVCTETSATVSTATSQAIGQVTASSITAPTVPGYTFVNWTLGTGISNQSASTSANPINVKTLGTGTYTMRANYSEVLTSTYKLKGAFDSWGSGIAMSKKSGHSMEDWVYCTYSFTENGTTGLKIHDGSSTWFGAQNADNSLEKTIGSLVVDGWTLTSTNGGNDIYFKHYISGTYEFAYNTSTKEFKVTWPDVNQVYISAASPVDATNTNAFDLGSAVSNVRSKTLTLNAKTTYTFKIVYQSDWYGNNSGSLTRSTSTSSNTKTLNTSGGNLTLTTDYAGEYTFKFNQSTKTLSIDFPEAYQIHFDVGNVKGNKYTLKAYYQGMDMIEANRVYSDNTWILKNNKVVFYTGNNDPTLIVNPGYEWWGYFNNAAGSMPTKYSTLTGWTTDAITSKINVYAVFGEIDYNVLVESNDATNAGTVAQSYMTAHVSTKETIPTATAKTGFYFVNWTKTGTANLYSTTSATDAQINGVTANDAVTVTANFAPKWSVAGIGSWDVNTNKFSTAYYQESSKWKGNKTIVLAANTEYEIKTYDIENSQWYGTNHSTDYVHIYYANSSTSSSLSDTDGSAKNLHIHSAAGGSYTFKWNVTDKAMQIVYPTSRFITSGQKTEGQADNAGGSFTAVDDSSNDVKGGKFVADNASVIFTAAQNTGYTFDGWYTNEACTDGKNASNPMTVSSITTDKTVYAKFVPNTYTVTLTRTGDGYGSGGDASATATFNAALPSATMPTAAQGYGFMGFYSAANGEGRQFINPSGEWVANAGDTISDSKWILDNGITLYAYYKEAQITGITFSPGNIVAPSATVTVTATIEPIPAGTTTICWRVLYSNDNPLDPQPTFTPVSGGTVSFPAHSASGSYKVEATLRKGAGCGGDEIHTFAAPFQVAGDHTVTVQYKCGDTTIKAPASVTGKPLQWTEITAPEIVGYSFSKWVEGDGITIEGATDGEKESATINFKAIYDGKLTAVYTSKRMIYFNNTLGWNGVTVYFYKNASYWDDSNGAGANTTYGYTGTPYSDGKHGDMTQIEGTNIWYFDLDANEVPANLTTVNFTELNQHGYGFFAETGSVKNNVAHPCNNAALFNVNMPMYVPIDDGGEWKNGGLAKYYIRGYWMCYPNYSGYTLKIYNTNNRETEPTAIKSFDFPYSDGYVLPMSVDVDLEANKKYYFDVYRNDNTLFGNNGDMVYGNSGPWSFFNTDTRRAGITTTAAGNYRFTWSFFKESSTYNYYMTVTYPVALNDYRIYYTDNATWSKDAHVKNTWYHPSGVIAKNTDESATKYDTVSFYVSKDNSPAMKFQYASSITPGTGAVTWANVASGDITIPSGDVTTPGVYNFIVKQVGTANPTIEKVEPYTGNYYIRVDCANSKWDNYSVDPDHLLTYSEYSITHGGYSHYYTHWVQTDDKKNVKFCIANDYSPCISDTLIRENNSDPAWTNINNYIESNGDLKRNANVRFMWNQSTNKISRAYVDGAQEDGSRFLVLSSTDGKIKKADGSALENNEVTFKDNENWIYEANIQAQPKAAIKLISTWGTSNTITQYFKGTSSTTEDLIDGSGENWYNIRLLYDFKTNRLVAAMVPKGNIDDPTPIHADVMFIREHQGDIDQLTFTEDGSITDIETAYAVMRFNKWTLNNKEKTGSHNPLASPASIYERSLYYVSFPFRVKLSEVFGFGTYGQHWIIQRYRGDLRAQQGYWAESAGFWEFIWNRNGEVYLEPNEGYILTLETELLGEESSVWGPDSRSSQIELFFPSYGTMPNITNTSITQTLPAHTCTINRAATEGLPDTSDPSTSYNRTIFDSHWNIMSVPTYLNVNNPSLATTTWLSNDSCPKFLYTWNPDDNTLTATSGTGFMYHAMHAYTVQYYGNVTWTTSVSPAAAPQRNTEYRGEYEFCLEVQQDEQMIDRTFVRLSDDENVTTGFEFGEDMTKQFNSRKANIFTIAGNTSLGGNSLPLSTTQTTVVPVGVSIKNAGDYTFAIPQGTEGIGVTLMDNETGVRTSLSALDYTVTLQPGNITDRFVLEISPIAQTPTGVETVTGEGLPVTGVRKVMIDGILYIVKDGKIFDARGARVE